MRRPGQPIYGLLPVAVHAPVHIVVGIGDDSAGQLCERTSTALATGLGVSPSRFPGGHTSFADDPAAFEPVLRAVLAGG